jgi:hypothetical protein
MGVLPRSFTPGIEFRSKFSEDNPKVAVEAVEKEYPIFVSYGGVTEKILITPQTCSTEFAKALLAICGIAYEDDMNDVYITLWTSKNEQVLGVLQQNTTQTAYRILISGFFKLIQKENLISLW